MVQIGPPSLECDMFGLFPSTFWLTRIHYCCVNINWTYENPHSPIEYNTNVSINVVPVMLCVCYIQRADPVFAFTLHSDWQTLKIYQVWSTFSSSQILMWIYLPPTAKPRLPCSFLLVCPFVTTEAFQFPWILLNLRLKSGQTSRERTLASSRSWEWSSSTCQGTYVFRRPRRWGGQRQAKVCLIGLYSWGKAMILKGSVLALFCLHYTWQG